MSEGFTRRVFLHRLTFFGGGVLLYACKRESPAPTRHAVLTTSHRTFTDDEWAVLTHAVDRVLPRDEDAGALEANVPEYIDRMLQSEDLVQMRQDFVDGLGALDRRSQRMHQKGFAAIAPEQQDELLTLFKNSHEGTGEEHFYELLIALTLEGFLGDPSYGGNKNHLGWALVGFETSEPPPGYDGMKMHHLGR